MIKNPKIDTDEINLIELMLTVWEGKWKIAAAVVISLLAVIYYQSNKTYNFTAITEVKYVGSLEISRYHKFNNLVKNSYKLKKIFLIKTHPFSIKRTIFIFFNYLFRVIRLIGLI